GGSLLVMSIRVLCGLFAFSLLLTSATSCGRHADNSRKLDNSHVRSLTTRYGLATSKFRNPPGNEKEFKQALPSFSVTPEKMNIGSFDELFVSERDGKRLIVIYGNQNKNSDVLVYEQTGANGKRLLGHRIGMVEEVDDAQLQTLTKQ